MKKYLYTLLPLLSSLVSAQGEVIWEKSIGGENAEYLYNAIPTPDYGFLILGSSSSNSSGDIRKENQGNLDYFLWKMDENGKLEWENTFGGDGNDLLFAGKPTPDGGYLLVGSSTSTNTGDKLSIHLGSEDIWVLKLDGLGHLQWQLTFGGIGNDIPIDVITTKDGGYLIASNSNSPLSEFKNSELLGSNDIYLIKLTSKGKVSWEKTYGGEFEDVVKSVIETDTGYLIVGNSNSPLSGNKTVDHNGSHVWVNQIDKMGNSYHQTHLNIDSNNRLVSFEELDNQYVFTVQELKGEEKVTSLIYTDKALKQFNKLEIELDDELSLNEVKHQDSNLLVVANKISTLGKSTSTGNIESYYVAKMFDENGKENWSKQLGTTGFNYLEKCITTRDGSIILFGNSTQQPKGSKGQSDFYIVKLGKKENDLKREYVEAYPNPTQDIVNVLINKEFGKASVEVYNLAGQHLQTKEARYRSTPISLMNYPSGVYVLKIKYDNQTESIKIIKK